MYSWGAHDLPAVMHIQFDRVEDQVFGLANQIFFQNLEIQTVCLHGSESPERMFGICEKFYGTI